VSQNATQIDNLSGPAWNAEAASTYDANGDGHVDEWVYTVSKSEIKIALDRPIMIAVRMWSKRPRQSTAQGGAGSQSRWAH
jgi:hypothetical protein